MLQALSAGGVYLQSNAAILDNLNVFPVPDGDTGMNMVATIRRGINQLTDTPGLSIPRIAEILTSRFSEDSRGNSGFILSRFFTGFFEVIKGHRAVDIKGFATGFSNGAYLARTALLSPVEGTMITIIAAMADTLVSCKEADLTTCLAAALNVARSKIHETPAMLPVLARAGVVDSGGLGFIFLMEGMYRGLTGQPLQFEDEKLYRFEPRETSGSLPAELPYRYCVELTVEMNGEPENDGMKRSLRAIGNSIALANVGSQLKLHIHTNQPEAVFELFSESANILRKKVDDMAEQVSAFSDPVSHTGAPAVVALVPGEGFGRIFLDLGAKKAMIYGEHLPSVGEITTTLSALDDRNIIVLPNDSNIIPSAVLAAEKSNANVIVVPSRNIVQGISAICAYVDDESLEENAKNMRECLDGGIQIEIHRAVRDSQFGLIRIRTGDYFAISEDDVLSAGVDPLAVITEALEKVDLPGRGGLRIFYGDGNNDRIAGDLAATLRSRYSTLEIEVVHGGQAGALLILAVD